MSVENKIAGNGSFSVLRNCLLQPACCLLILFTVFFPHTIFAQKAIPELWGQRVHDEAHVLSQPVIDSLENALAAYEDSTTNQITILTVASLDGDGLEDYTLRVAEKWKLGQKDKDNGVLLFAAIDDHKMRIEVGQGLEGVLTDATASRIIRNEIAPNFRRDDYDAGIKAGVTGIIQAIGGEYTSGDDSTNTSDIDNMTTGQRIGFGLGMFAFLGIFAFFGLFAPGKTGWLLYVFLMPFYAVSLVPAVGSGYWYLPGLIYIIGFPILKLLFGKSAFGQKVAKNMNTSSGGGSGRSSRGSGWSSGGGGSSFSGGGGSFGGGGSSGSW